MVSASKEFRDGVMATDVEKRTGSMVALPEIYQKTRGYENHGGSRQCDYKRILGVKELL